MVNSGEGIRDASGRIVLLNRDLFFGVRIRQVAATIGYKVDITPKSELFVEKIQEPDVALGIIDIGAAPDWTVIASATGVSLAAPILAFGPHKDVDGLRGAKQAGVTRVVSNGDFHKDIAAFIQRYARR